jgi:hypothetical protein
MRRRSAAKLLTEDENDISLTLLIIDALLARD